ncbi:MAG: protein phosphatase 2C domain-containing protein [Deltaproteobacteria bacterium]|nr:protein phosphatase 2C domain-containing protein [Deltaproteobacteria bacterium]
MADNSIVVALSDRGGREENQDAWGLARTADGSLVLALADGLGGHMGGRVASQKAVSASLNFLFEDTNINKDSIIKAFELADNEIFSSQKDELYNMCSTLTLAIIKENQLIWGYVGDSRLYLLRDNKVHFQTLDHTIAQVLVASGEINAADIRGCPDRNILTKALGRSEPEARPTMGSEENLRAYDTLVLATDGFWEWIDEEQLKTLVFTTSEEFKPTILRKKLRTLEDDLKNIAKFNKNDYDNYSAVIFTK